MIWLSKGEHRIKIKWLNVGEGEILSHLWLGNQMFGRVNFQTKKSKNSFSWKKECLELKGKPQELSIVNQGGQKITINSIRNQ